MKQKEFRDLLVEYVEEIADPKNKEVEYTYNRYLIPIRNMINT